MTRPLPIFRLVFAAYYATSDEWAFDDEGVFRHVRRRSRSEFPVLVVDNDADPAQRKSLRLRQIARERQSE
jgi:hypothetical protein